ncbi:hypothetical protein P4193_00845 [Pseudomonas aeruginosa]|nr:hypothetical protein [Pseudomonas aeruginosa]
MPKLPMLALAAVAAAVISVPASAGDRITIQTEVTKGGVVLSSGTQEISKGLPPISTMGVSRKSIPT